MSDKDNDSFELSRRKALAGIGGIGTATALGGIGTYAQFTDTEEESVTFTAGGVDGIVRYGANYNGNTVKSFGDGYVDNEDITNVTIEEDNGGVGLKVTLDDVKPGDYGCFSFGIQVQNNPAWVAACIGYENDTDGTVFEPEVEPDGDLEWDGNDVVDSDGDVIGTYDPQADEPIAENVGTNGELPHELLFIPFYGGQVSEGGQFDPCIFFDSENEEFNPEAYEGSGAVSTPGPFWDNATDDLEPATLLQILQQSYVDSTVWGDGGNEITEQNIVNPPGVAEGCVFLNGEVSTENEKEAAVVQPGQEFRFGWDWHLPFDTGNEVQGDSMTLNLGFTFSQVRHTEDVTLNNIYSPDDNTPN
jgi:predicted ribosomally synthesized peptide with SipW-like signal peptide